MANSVIQQVIDHHLLSLNDPTRLVYCTSDQQVHSVKKLGWLSGLQEAYLSKKGCRILDASKVKDMLLESAVKAQRPQTKEAQGVLRDRIYHLSLTPNNEYLKRAVNLLLSKPTAPIDIRYPRGHWRARKRDF